MNQGGFNFHSLKNQEVHQIMSLHQPSNDGYLRLQTNAYSFQCESYMAQSHLNFWQYSQFANRAHHNNQFHQRQYNSLQNINEAQHRAQIEPNITNMPIPNPPLIDANDSYVHYQYIDYLKNNYKFDHVSVPPPYSLVAYLLKYLSLECCPYSLSALSYIATNVPHFYVHFAPHELHFLEQLINHKYPYHLDYKTEYKKLLIMNKSQAAKLLDLLQTICILVSQFEQQKKCFKNIDGDQRRDLYIIWVMNCLHAMLAHRETLEALPLNQRGEHYAHQLNHLKQNIQSHAQQFMSLIWCISDQSNDESLWHKINMLIYDLVPSSHVSQQIELLFVIELIQITSKITYGRRYNKLSHPQLKTHQRNSDEQLFNTLHKMLSCQMTKISKEALKIQGKLFQNNTIVQLHHKFCFKVLNILSLKRWSKHQNYQLIKFISGCNFVCGAISKSREQKSKESSDLLSYAFQIIKQRPCHNQQMRKHQQLPLFDQTQNANDDDLW